METRLEQIKNNPDAYFYDVLMETYRRGGKGARWAKYLLVKEYGAGDRPNCEDDGEPRQREE